MCSSAVVIRRDLSQFTLRGRLIGLSLSDKLRYLTIFTLPKFSFSPALSYKQAETVEFLIANTRIGRKCFIGVTPSIPRYGRPRDSVWNNKTNIPINMDILGSGQYLQILSHNIRDFRGIGRVRENFDVPQRLVGKYTPCRVAQNVAFCSHLVKPCCFNCN